MKKVIKSPLQVYFWVRKNASIQKLYFKYTSNFECKFVGFKSLLEVYFLPTKEIKIHFKKLKYKVEVFRCLQYVWSILEIYSKYASSILEVYFITKFLMGSKYTWNLQI